MYYSSENKEEGGSSRKADNLDGNMFDIIIVGGGAAGLSAAIYTSRSGFDTALFDKGDSSLRMADVIENYLGFPEGIDSNELLKRSREQALKNGTNIIEEEVLSVSRKALNGSDSGDGVYKAETSSDTFEAEGLIIATGTQHDKPDIEGLEELEGRGVSYCVMCDGPLYKGKKCVVVGSKSYAAKEALELREFTDDVTLITNGKDLDIESNLLTKLDNKEVKIVEKNIDKVEGDKVLEAVYVEGDKIDIDGLFVATGGASSLDFARKLGIGTKDGNIDVGQDMLTDVPRVYAAGDCTGSQNQVAVAVGEGAIASINLMEDLKE